VIAFPSKSTIMCSSTPEGYMYIKGYLYPIQYPKISKKDIFYPFLEQDILRIYYPNFRDFKISYLYPILYPFFNVQCPRLLGFRGKIFPCEKWGSRSGPLVLGGDRDRQYISQSVRSAARSNHVPHCR
jgi:hypothetical protein